MSQIYTQIYHVYKTLFNTPGFYLMFQNLEAKELSSFITVEMFTRDIKIYVTNNNNYPLCNTIIFIIGFRLYGQNITWLMYVAGGTVFCSIIAQHKNSDLFEWFKDLLCQSCYWEFVQRNFWEIQGNQKSLICQTPPGLHSIRYMLVSVSLTRCPYITLSPSLFGKKYWQKKCLHNSAAQRGKFSYPKCNRKKIHTNPDSKSKEVVLYIIECASNQVNFWT